MNTGTKEKIYAFLVDYFDPHARMIRKYHMKYFTESHQIEMVDEKTKKLFLKRSACPPAISPKDFYLGSQMLVHGRTLALVDYADEYTKSQLSSRSQRSFAIVTPDGALHLGKILDRFLASDLLITRLRSLQLSTSEVEALLQWQQQRDGVDLSGLARAASSGVSVAVEVSGEQPVEKVLSLTASLQSRFAAGQEEPAVLCCPAADQTENYHRVLFGTRRAATATFTSCTCAVVQPHLVRAGALGKILDAVLEQGFEISALQMFSLSRDQAAEFLEVYQGVIPTFSDAVTQLCSGPCVAMEVRAQNAVQSFRETVGPWDIVIARTLRPDSIRAKFGEDRVKNALHCTDLPEDAVLECQYFFDILQE